MFCLSFQSILINLDVKYDLPVRTYYCDFSTSLALQDCKAVSSTVELANSVTSDSVDLFNFAMWACASKCFPIEPVPSSDGWQRTWWQTILMMPGLPVSSIPQWKPNRHKGACLDLFQAIGRFEPTFIEAHQGSKMIWKVRSLKSLTKTRSLLEEIITSHNEVFKCFKFDMALNFKSWLIRLERLPAVTIKQCRLRLLKYWLYSYQ